VRYALAALLCIFAADSTSAQIDPATAILEQTGFDALNAGQAARAAEAFTRALTADPKNARLHWGAGVAAFMDRRDDDAKRELERALELDPQLLEARRFLGAVLHSQGDLPGAIRAYEAALAAAPGDRETADTLERWRRERELQDRMDRAVGDRFTVSFEGPAEAAVAAKAIESLDRAYWRIGQLLGAYPLEPVPVVLYTTEQFRDITRSPPWAAGSYDGTIRVPMRGAFEKASELDRVLAHEFTHALVHTLAPRAVPTWLNEGLAAALESDDLSWAAASLAPAAPPVSLTALASSFGRLNSDEAAVAYATSALAVRALFDDIGGAGITNLLRDLGMGVDLDTAFSHRVSRSLADFSASLAASVSRGR
jgi:tetratricopeptide (TPR) repeat protein